MCSGGRGGGGRGREKVTARTGVQTCNLDKIGAVQSRAARFVLNRFHNTSSVRLMLEQLNWPSLQQRRKTAPVSMMYKTNSDLVLSSSLGAKLEPLPPRQRRRHQHLTVIPCRTQFRQHAFLPRTVRDWNALPKEAVEANALDTFVARVSRSQ